MFIDKLPGTDNVLETRELVNKLIFGLFEKLKNYINTEEDIISEEDCIESSVAVIESSDSYFIELVRRVARTNKGSREKAIEKYKEDLKEVVFDVAKSLATSKKAHSADELIKAIENVIYKVLKDFADDKN